MPDQPVRCTIRKHVQENGSRICDCGKVTIGRTAARNALVVTLLDPVQREALTKMEPRA